MTTKNLVPRTSGQGQIGTSAKKWSQANFVAGSFDSLTVGGSSITAASDIEGVTAGDGLSGGGTTGTVSLALNLNDLTAAAVDVASDSIAIIDANDSNGSKKESLADLITAVAGDGLAASSGILAVGVDDSTIETNSDALRVKDSGITLAKIVNISNLKVLGNTSGGDAAPAEIGIDTDLTSVSSTDNTVASAKAIKTYIDSSVSGVATNSITQGNTSVTATDSGSDGKITFNTEGTDRWEITSSGHLYPSISDSLDIGSASKKVKDLYVGDNSIKFVDDSNAVKALSRSGNDLQWVGETLTTKSYVDSAISGLAILENVDYLFQSALFATNFTHSVSSGVDIFTQNSAGTSSMSRLLQSASAGSSDYHLDNEGDLNGVRVLILGGVSSGISQRYAGIYVITSGNATGSSSGTPYVFTRASDFTTGQRANGKYVFVKSGYWADKGFVCSSDTGSNNTILGATSSSIISGRAYKVITIGSTDFVSYGAASNTVGVTFIYNGSSKSGSGTVQSVEDYVGSNNDITFTQFSSPAGVGDDGNLKILNNKYEVSLDGSYGKTIYEDTRINTDLNGFYSVTSMLLSSSSSYSSPYYKVDNRITPINAFLNSKKAIESITLKQFPILNLDYVTNTEVESGFILNIKPSANVYLGSSSTNTLTNTGTYFQITGDVTSNFSANDLLVFIDRSELGERNTGIFEVHDVSEVSGNTRITYKNSSNAPTSAVAAFVKQSIATGSGMSQIGNKLFKAKICVIKTDKTTDKLQYAFGDNATSLTFSTINDITADADPVLGGDLDVGTFDIVSSSARDIELDPNGAGKVIFKGNSTKGSGQFVLNCENNSHGVTIKGPPHSAAASYTLILPSNDGDADQVLKTDGSGALSWASQSSGGGGGSRVEPKFVGENTNQTSFTIGTVISENNYMSTPVAAYNASVGGDVVAETVVGSSEIERVYVCKTGLTSITLPTSIGLDGFKVQIKRIGSTSITINTNGSQTIDGDATKTLDIQYASLTLISDDANWYVI